MEYLKLIIFALVFGAFFTIRGLFRWIKTICNDAYSELSESEETDNERKHESEDIGHNNYSNTKRDG